MTVAWKNLRIISRLVVDDERSTLMKLTTPHVPRRVIPFAIEEEAGFVRIMERKMNRF
jgi:hypothetical protein